MIEGRAEVLEAVERARVAMRLLGASRPARERAMAARVDEDAIVMVRGSIEHS